MKPHIALLFLLSAFCAPASAAPLQIFVAGDVLLGRGVARTLDASDNALQKWQGEITRADLAFCNLECAISPQKPQKNTQLLASPTSCKYLQRAGFDLVSTANNHALDDGENGVRLTQNTLAKSNIATVGSRLNRENWSPFRATIRGQRVAWLAATAWGPFQRGAAQVRPLAGSGLIEQVRKLTRAGELVFVSLHWGIEYSAAPTDGQKRTARALINAGAIAIIGHHPHVVQSVETYRGRPIFYSLGNFLFDRTPRAQSGMAAVIAVDEKRNVSWRSFDSERAVETARWGCFASTVRLRGQLPHHAVSAKADCRNRRFPQRAVSTARPPLPTNETLIAQHPGHFLPNEKRPQILTWTQPKTGPHRLRLLVKTDNSWRVVAQGFHPSIWDLQIGDIDGDGRDDIIVGLFQRAKLDPQIKRRLHIYDVNPKGGLRPKWRGSALSRPFQKFVLLPSEKGVDVVALETNPLPEYHDFQWLAIYRWNGFGLKLIWDTPVRGTISELKTGTDARGAFVRFRQKADTLNRALTLRMRHNKAGVISFKAEVESE